MPEQADRRSMELTDQNKVVSLFRFVQELNKLKQNAILNVEDYPWFFPLSRLPDAPHSITIQYRDRVENEESGVDSTILSVKKPEYQRCPEPDPIFRDWLEAGWESFKKTVQVKEILASDEETDHSEATPEVVLSEDINAEMGEPEHFKDDERRVEAFNKWLQEREIWAEKQGIIAQTRALFSRLFELYFELQKEPETKELVVANGILYDRENKNIQHPVLTHRVTLKFDPDRNIVTIEDSDAPSELYSAVFQMMDNVNLTVIKQLDADLQANDYHPLDRNDTPDFLKHLVNQLSSESIFCEGVPPEKWWGQGRLLLSLEPCFIFRKRLDGTLKAIEQIIENVQETGWIPKPIIDIVSGGTIDIPEETGEETVEDRLAAVGGESVDILLSKEANREQLEIAKRIEQYSAVLVQGPPGTGKTHTIANLMGHFLAQGKSVLVTSYTPKALSVLKEKVAPGLQDLCVSVLDDSNTDMERSIDGITDYMGRTTSFEVKKEIDTIAVERKEIIRQLANVRRKIFTLINQECDNIVLNGEAISPSKAASFVCDHADELSYIPGNVRLRAPLPLTFEQLRDLYRSNESVSQVDEEELNFDLPNPTEILSPSAFAQERAALQDSEARISAIACEQNCKILPDLKSNSVSFSGKIGTFIVQLPTEIALGDLTEHIRTFGCIEPWMKCIAVDGKNGGAYRQRWNTLINQIRETCKLADSVVGEQFGRKITFRTGDTAHLRGVYEKIRTIYAEKGKISKITLVFNKDIESALNEVSIDGHSVQSTEDCDAVLHYIKLESLRTQCALFWDELLAVNGLPEFFDLDIKHPESIAAKLIPQLERYLDWYQTDYQRLTDLMEEANLPADILFSHDVLDSDLVYTGKILDAVDRIVPFVCECCSCVLRIREGSAKLLEAQRILTCERRENSRVCQSMVQMLENGDAPGYAKAFSELTELYQKYDLQHKREELLQILVPFAPSWAEAIRSRSGIHGKPTVPETIEDAWKWKQLSGIIAELTAQPYEQLQEENLCLSRAYRRATAKYAEKCGWYHLLRRTEADIDLKQALVGWKLTVKRIGKGTGKTAPALKAKARELMAKCQSAVPGWIMTINRALESLNPKTNRFDVVIIDEASQADVSSLAILYMGSKLIIVGDDKQVSPMGVGVEVNKMSALEQMYINGKIPNSHLYNAKTSIYDIAATTFQPLMLREHFRCVPEIIGFSNMLSYDYKIKPLRDASKSELFPAVVNYRVENGRRKNKTNLNEARAIVALIQACIEQPEYAGKSFGVISLLGDEQAKLIQQMVEKKINAKEIVSRKILCGNSANFQGDERDVVFLSLVDSANGTGPVHLQNFGPDDSYRKRYNVAVSRARDQLWVVDSLDSASDLKPGDIRKKLIEYSINPKSFDAQREEIEENAESPFEEGVARALSDRGYHLVQQWKVGAYRLDMVAVCGKKTVAIECDGERWHSGEEKIREDMERQTILERLGWRFIRIRGSEYYRDAEKTISRVVHELEAFGIEPEATVSSPEETRETELLKRVKRQAELILLEEREADSDEPIEDTIAGALNPQELTRNLPKEPERLFAEPISEPNSEIDRNQAIKAEERLSNGEISHQSEPQPNQAQITENKELRSKTHTSPRKRKPDKKKAVQEHEQMMIPGIEKPTATTDITTLLKKHKVKFVDNRNRNGALWILGGQELAPIVEECKALGVNFKFKADKPGWWTK